MEDNRIIALLFARDAGALDECRSSYGAYCRAIARNILGSEDDAE